MAAEKVIINKKEFYQVWKSFFIQDDEEYSFKLNMPRANEINIVIVFKDVKEGEKSRADWSWTTSDSVTITFHGWKNVLGFTSLTERRELATIYINSKPHQLYFQVASQHVPNANLVNMFFYLAAT